MACASPAHRSPWTWVSPSFCALAEGRLDLIDGHSTNGLIADLHRHRLQDDRGYSPLRSRARVPRRQPELAPLP
jgi:glycine betaine/choline ABC-type transport system substrate-binding protein